MNERLASVLCANTNLNCWEGKGECVTASRITISKEAEKASWGRQQPAPALKQTHMAHDYSTLLWEGWRWHGNWWGRVIMAEEAGVSSMHPTRHRCTTHPPL